VDYVRVRLYEAGGQLMAEPILGKSGLINTMVRADGLIAIGMNTEGVGTGCHRTGRGDAPIKNGYETTNRQSSTNQPEFRPQTSESDL
jgi:hypothetical protein